MSSSFKHLISCGVRQVSTFINVDNKITGIFIQKIIININLANLIAG